MTEQEIRESIDRYSRLKHRGRLHIHADTSEFMHIEAGYVLELGESFYLIRGEESETRFGLDGEPKFWVKRAIDLKDGSAKIIKLVFHEAVEMRIGEYRIRCYRSPQKEGRILEKIRSDPYFMHGITVQDSVGNTVRIVDRIQGTCLYDFIHNLEVEHEGYFRQLLPGILRSIITSIEAVSRLHGAGEVHGDVRTDHILIERGTGLYRWIDFDFSYDWLENPFGVDLFGLGNVLLFVMGKGFHTTRDLPRGGPQGAATLAGLREEDLSLYSANRIMNLRKLFPYIPESLNQILLHFACGANIFYEETQELLEDLRASLRDLTPPEWREAA